MKYFTIIGFFVFFISSMNAMEELWKIPHSKRVKSAEGATGDAEYLLTTPLNATSNPCSWPECSSETFEPKSLPFQGFIPLHEAVFRGEAQTVKLLLGCGANVNSQTATGKTALHAACALQTVDCMRILVAANANVFLRDNEGNLPLDCSQVNSELYTELLMYMYSIRLPLHYASLLGNLEAVEQWYKDNSSNSNQDLCVEADLWGRTPLHCAVERGHFAVIEFLLFKGAPLSVVCHKGQTPIHYAALKGSVRILRLLLDYLNHDALIITDNDGFTAHDYALQSIAYHALLVKLSPTIPKSIVHSSVQERAPVALRPTGEDLLALVSDVQPTSRTLHEACQSGNLACVKYFIENKLCGVDSPDDGGVIPLMHTLTHETSCTAAICKLLIERGADLSFVDLRGRNILHLIALGGHHQLLEPELLVKYPRNLFDALDELGNTPLHYAVEHSVLKTVVPFVSHHNVHCYNKNHERPYDKVVNGRKLPLKILPLINPTNY